MGNSQRWMVIVGLVLGGLLIYLLQPILMPFLVGALLAYLGDPLADRLQRLRLPRSAAVMVVFALLVLVIGGLALLLVPMIGDQVRALQANLPAMLAWAQDTALPWIERHAGLELTEQLALDRVGSALAAHWQQTGDVATMLLQRVSSSGLMLFGWLANLFLIPVVTFYLLRDWDLLVARVRDLLPRRTEPRVAALTRECDEVLGAFLRGQFLVMLSLGAIYAAGLWVIGLDLALLIGMLAGLASIVPYLGTVVGIAAAAIAALYQFGDLWHLVAVALVFGAGQMLEGMVLTPLLVGDRIGMHPVAVIFAVLAGGQLFGFVGVLLGLPAAAVVMVLLRHVHDLYKDSTLYAERTTQPPPPD
ncbi:MAG: AI-2E family transporter [Halofilum sp. (in: g-proteobacteria)]|nr:AI-2E family transporter [Halofilum sp. (in: g-proteobacteria)]